MTNSRQGAPSVEASQSRLSDALLRNRRARPQRTAIIDGDVVLGWAELSGRVTRFASALRELGVTEGARVAILSLNSRYVLESFFAISWAGGIYTPLNFRLALHELIDILNDCDAGVLIVDATHAGLVPELIAATGLRAVISTDGAPEADMLSYEALLAQALPCAPSLRGGEDVCALFYTSGSTGRPKGVMHTHANVIAMATTVVAHAGFDDHTIFCMPGPLFHVGAAGTMLPVLIAGGAVVVVPRYDPPEFVSLIQCHRINGIGLVPTMLRMLVDAVVGEEIRLISVGMVIYGAAPMNDALLADALHLLPHAKFLHWYGLTEITAAATALPYQYILPENRNQNRANSIGRAMIGLHVAIVDTDDQEVPAGVVGEIVIRGPVVMKGYWGKPEQTAEAIRNGYLHTGDAGYMDDEGFIFLADRMKDMIISGGENVYSIEVEQAIYEYPGVAQCAVIGIPHPKWGETVHAIIHASPGADVIEEAIISHCRARIAGYKVPRSVEFHADPLPLSGANKINKPALRSRFWEGRAGKPV